MRHDQDRLDRQLFAAPQIQQVGAQGFGGEHVQGRERFVHQQQRRVDHQAACEANALAHAAGQFAGVGVFETIQADQVDGRQGALAGGLAFHLQGLQARFDVFQHGQPGKQGKGLEHHGHAFGRAGQRCAVVAHLAGRCLDQPGDNTQQRGFAGAGAAQHADDLAFVQGQVHTAEDLQFIFAFAEYPVHVFQREDFRRVGGVYGVGSHHSESHQFKRSLFSAMAYIGRQTARLKATTKIDITTTPRVILGKSPAAVVCAM